MLQTVTAPCSKDSRCTNHDDDSDFPIPRLNSWASFVLLKRGVQDAQGHINNHTLRHGLSDGNTGQIPGFGGLSLGSKGNDSDCSIHCQGMAAISLGFRARISVP